MTGATLERSSCSAASESWLTGCGGDLVMPLMVRRWSDIMGKCRDRELWFASRVSQQPRPGIRGLRIELLAAASPDLACLDSRRCQRDDACYIFRRGVVRLKGWISWPWTGVAPRTYLDDHDDPARIMQRGGLDASSCPRRRDRRDKTNISIVLALVAARSPPGSGCPFGL